eukprot:m.71169 g.71169  ORF g.71169 m.71169 type:complete len:122 (+) comp35736_c0_seq1:888-1253(+)
MESDLTDKEWKKSKAIISTIEAARKRSLGAQLFLAIFNNPREGHNVYQIAANNGYIPRKRQGFIAAQRVVDASLGDVFFNNPWSSVEDVLANATSAAIQNYRKSCDLPFRPTATPLKGQSV